MCRSIKQLRKPDYYPDDDEIHAAALQFIRKVSGYRKPSRKNKDAFDRAVSEVAISTRRLLENIQQVPLKK